MKKRIVYLQCILILIIYVIGNNFMEEKVKYYKEMILAKNNVESLFKEIKKRKEELGVITDIKLDINNTGMIGEEFTGTTTTMGDLDSKRLSTNSNFAAYFVRKFKEKGLKKGDLVLVNMSSSFPAINLSLISALDVLDLKGVLVNSIGSSMYGANNEEITFLEMAKYLEEKKLIKNRILAYSWGGDWDIGNNIDSEIKEKIKLRIKNYKIKFFYNKELNKNLEERYKFYSSFGKPKYFINIGGNILFERLIKKYEKEGIEILSILDLKFIGNKLGLSIKQNEKIKNIKIYYKNNNYVKEIFIILIFLIGIIFMKK